jgi:multiple sugar transport system ATP-binding protein
VTPLLQGAVAQAARRAKGRVVYGFRPEQVDLGDGLTMAVDVVERIGARTIVHMGAVRVVLENAAVGATLGFVPHPGAVRLFDANSGVALNG